MKKKYFSMLLFLFIFLQAPNIFALRIDLYSFYLRNYVYYQILYKLQGISPKEFDKITISDESSRSFSFEHSGKKYKAIACSKGCIFVKMPEGMQDRMLYRAITPHLILGFYRND